MTARPYTIEWYRPHHLRQIVRVCVPCAFITSVSVFCIAVALGHTGVLEVFWALVGVLLALTGPTLAAFGMRNVLREDVYLELRSDGLVYKRDDRERRVPWDRLDAAEGDNAAGTLVLRIEDAPTMRISDAFIGADAETLAKRILDVRRRALMDLLPAAPPRPA